ncbi:hypothetical protein AM1BK_12630 [Neobacillus kokaensis]|uniref:Uncharacterized protein n=1 Tax=Neobacillus kokaensis TaxID=2759023 RepID=A0ABQ3N5C0_9BACI|nr:hypothetical protein AM1BK_12630 [Neobacillus kokaensis]
MLIELITSVRERILNIQIILGSLKKAPIMGAETKSKPYITNEIIKLKKNAVE